MPLYTIWANGTPRDIVLAALHCAAGDVLIALASLVASLLLVGDARWPAIRFRAVAWLAISFGLAYTALSEWLNVTIRASWAYSDLMPVLSLGPVDLGLSPMLQWIVIPALSLRVARGGH